VIGDSGSVIHAAASAAEPGLAAGSSSGRATEFGTRRPDSRVTADPTGTIYGDGRPRTAAVEEYE
jgi:hypothetical protein